MQPPPPPFIDRTEVLGLSSVSGSVSFGDFEQDGFPDLLSDGSLWINRSGDRFERFDAPCGGLLVNLDNDFFADLVCFNPPSLYRGGLVDSKPTFTRIEVPAIPETVCQGAAAGDFNADAIVDVYFGGYEDWGRQLTYPSVVLMSNAAGGYDVRVMTNEYRTRGVTACDFDQDGDLDIYASNYRLQPNLLWVNNGKGEFDNQATRWNALATSGEFPGGHSIGACWGDFDADGRFDLFAGNFAHVDSRGDQPKSRFLRHAGDTFEDLGTCGVWYQESYASPACADYDNDGALDLFFTTVYADASFGKKNYPVLYRNESTNDAWRFTDVTAGSGLERLPPTYQASWADVNADGRIDLLTAGRLFINQSDSPGRSVSVRLQGDGKHVNIGAIGAQVRVKLDSGRIITRQVEAGTGERNMNSPILHLGIGDVSERMTIEILWPDGTRGFARDVKAGDRVFVRYGD